jgi:CRISPR-associated protein Csb2
MKTFIEVKWVAGEYSGVEFPPAPTRLLQAIVASSVDKYIDLLVHLETKLPVIYASREYSEFAFGTYVINNDERLEHINASRQKRHIMRRADDLRAIYEYDIDDGLLSAFCAAASRIMVLGRAGDFVIARASTKANVAGLDRFEPRAAGLVELNAPQAGFIDSVFQRYENRTALKLRSIRYAKNPSSARDCALFELTEPAAKEFSSHVVSWIRHSGMARLPDLSGHGDHDRRLGIVPVVTLDYRDHMIRRVIVTAPDAAAARNATARLAGLRLTSADGSDKGYLMPADSDAVFSDYLSPATHWRTVTPIVAPYDNGKIQKRMRNFARMFEQAGLPVPQRVTSLSGNPKQFFVGKHHEHLPRYFAEIEFAEPISGVVFAGAGRYAGLGIFASLSRSATA